VQTIYPALGECWPKSHFDKSLSLDLIPMTNDLVELIDRQYQYIMSHERRDFIR